MSSSAPQSVWWQPALPKGWERRVIGAAVELVQPAPAWALTQAAFDHVRLEAAQGPCPRARQLVRRTRTPWRELVADAAGLAPPERPEQAALPRQRRSPWARTEVLDAIAEFLDWADDRDPTVRLYRTWCADQPGRPWPRSLARHGGLGSLVQAVRLGEHHQPPDPYLRLLELSRTPLAGDVLGYVAEGGPVTAKHIAATLGADTRAVNARLRALHAAGAVERTRAQPPARRGRWRRGRPGARPYRYAATAAVAKSSS